MSKKCPFNGFIECIENECTLWYNQESFVDAGICSFYASTLILDEIEEEIIALKNNIEENK